MTQVLSTRTLDLRTFADYHKRVGAQTALTLYWSRSLRGSPAIRAFSGDTSHTFYRLLGSVPDDSWRRLENGRSATVGDLGVESAFAALLDEDRVPVQSPRPFSDVLRHARESFPDGDLQTASLSVSSSVRDMLGIQSPQGDGVVQWSDGIASLTILDVVEDPEKGSRLSMTREQYEQWLRNFKFQTGTQRQTVATIALPGDTFASAAFLDPVQTSSDLLRYDDLPVDLKNTLWKLACEAASRAKPGHPGSPDPVDRR